MRPQVGQACEAEVGRSAAARFLAAFAEAPEGSDVTVGLAEPEEGGPLVLFLQVADVSAALPVGPLTRGFLSLVRIMAAIEEEGPGGFGALAERIANVLAVAETGGRVH